MVMEIAGWTLRFLGETKEREPDVVILGDSMMSQLEQRGVWRDVFIPMHALNFSIVGDQIQQVLWRIQNGELDNIKPKVVVLYAGEPNLRCVDPQKVSEGSIEAVKAIREKQPDAFILVQEILPRGLNPNPLRDSIEQYNDLLRKALHNVPSCKVVPVGDDIVKPDGTISHADLYDWYYPTNDGYLKALGPLINELKSILQRCM
ncbi:platelet-activating factor acetylhydrolase IB subunit gamma-like isoform X2 [Thrips palmi]|uniref:Platelet-activating factor acetylhydrolase IB subunit gamma-like isoform X2 n=1 Tax=Thrips palmi TaxID=161013 RepID=A0A6P8ZUQ5_THRPL|nr:platelet-activating factor acetylhydrolase IB subunit gamma-like isoform X2 [Thrips palmi]